MSQLKRPISPKKKVSRPVATLTSCCSPLFLGTSKVLLMTSVSCEPAALQASHEGTPRYQRLQQLLLAKNQRKNA